MPTLHGRDKPEYRGLILGIAAKKQHGKDTFADWLIATEENWTNLKFADPMKRVAAAALNVTVEAIDGMKDNPYARVAVGQQYEELGFVAEHSITMREYIQRVGTEAHRDIPEFGDTIWLDMMRAKLEKPGRYVITDARFKNEHEMIKELGGYIIQVNRPGMPEGDGHASEQIDHGLADYVIENDSDLAAYAEKIVATLADIRRVRSR